MGNEDLTTYTLTGSNVSRTAARATATSLTNNEFSAIYADRTATPISGDFSHLLDVRCTATTDNNNQYQWWALANIIDDYNSISSASGDYFAVRCRDSAALALDILFVEMDGGTQYNIGNYAISLTTTYYLNVVRDESVGTYGTLYLYIYSDSARTTLLSTLSGLLHTSKKDWDYLYALQSGDLTQPTWITSGWMENLDLQEVVAAPSMLSLLGVGHA